MNRKSIDYAKDPALRTSLAALQRAAKRARRVAANTGTQLVVARNGKFVRVAPGAGRSPKA